jgi:hypothetical protein
MQKALFSLLSFGFIIGNALGCQNRNKRYCKTNQKPDFFQFFTSDKKAILFLG